MENVIEKIKAQLDVIQIELDKFLKKNNESAGVRARKYLQQIRKDAQELRVQIHKIRLERKIEKTNKTETQQ